MGEVINYSGVALKKEENQHFNCYIMLSKQNEIFSSKKLCLKSFCLPGHFKMNSHNRPRPGQLLNEETRKQQTHSELSDLIYEQPLRPSSVVVALHV